MPCYTDSWLLSQPGYESTQEVERISPWTGVVGTYSLPEEGTRAEHVGTEGGRGQGGAAGRCAWVGSVV